MILKQFIYEVLYKATAPNGQSVEVDAKDTMDAGNKAAQQIGGGIDPFTIDIQKVEHNASTYKDQVVAIFNEIFDGVNNANRQLVRAGLTKMHDVINKKYTLDSIPGSRAKSIEVTVWDLVDRYEYLDNQKLSQTDRENLEWVATSIYRGLEHEYADLFDLRWEDLAIQDDYD